MKGKTILIVSLTLLMAGVSWGDSWTLSANYLRFNQANPSGSTDNFGAGVSYDWLVNPNTTFAVEGIASWDNPAEVYGGGVNMKYHMGTWGELDVYGGGYADWIYARSLPSSTQGGPGSSKDGLVYGPLVGVKIPLEQNTALFAQYQYGWIDGSNLRDAFDEAQWVVVGLEMAF
jgi:hypothetical protein